ncbi:MAG: tetratricopeptide repeat protein [Myxococcota bacterium]|nr:tetratricopeptide repeat protein [Myxococcota bacterium]
MRFAMSLLTVLALLLSGCLTPRALQEGEHSRKMGLAYLSEGSVAAAVTEFRTAVKYNQWDAEAWHGLGMAYFATEKFEESEEALLKALKLEEEFPQARMNLGSLYLEVGRWDEAIASLKLAAEDPEYRQPARARHNLGWAYYSKGDYQTARSEYHEVLRRFPLFCPSIRNLGHVDEAEGKLPDALARYAQAVACDPTDLKSRLSQGIVEARLDLVSDACEHLTAVKDADPYGTLKEQANEYLAMLNCESVGKL